MIKREFFKDRKDATDELMQTLPLDKMKREEWILTGISLGGVAIASYLAQELDLKVEWLMGESIVAPSNAECELARVSETKEIVINDDLVKAFDIKYDYIYAEARRELEDKILANIYHYRKGRQLHDLEGKNILLLDDGAESGLKLMCAIKTVLLKSPNAIYAALPVIPRQVKKAVETICDEIFYVHKLDDYIETSCYYASLDNIGDKEIIKILEQHGV